MTTKMKGEKKTVLCSEEGCYNNVKIDEFTERYMDGTPHPCALKCDTHTTSKDIKKLKRFRKEQRRKGNPYIL